VSYPNPNSTTIGIVGGDPLVGHALELMLLSAGYSARFLEGISANGEADFFDGISLILIAPRSNDDDRKALLSCLHNGGSSTPSKTQVPVVELVATADRARAEEEGLVARHVLWPCRVKDLKREIEGALLNDSS
jgi:hypothetical protein